MATAEKHGVVRKTLRARFLSQSLSIPATASQCRQRLTLVQEETLIKHINSLTDRGIPPTSRIVRNLAEEMIRGPVEEDRTSDFVKRYQDRLKSLNLRNIDSQSVRAEYAPSFKHFYDLVTLIKRLIILNQAKIANFYVAKDWS